LQSRQPSGKFPEIPLTVSVITFVEKQEDLNPTITQRLINKNGFAKLSHMQNHPV